MSHPSSSSKRTTVSSPGKVLLAGGYLVLDPAHSGLVISTSSRFYTSISSSSASPPSGNIVVRSPQFTNATWAYSLSRAEENGVLELREEDGEGGKNKFVRIALEKTFRLAGEMVGAGEVEAMAQDGLEVVIVGDNDFYSQRKQLETLSLPLSLSSLEHLPPFSPTNDTLANVHKTGLGSSAALITSLCAALLLHLGAVSPQAFSSASSVPSPSPPSSATTSSSKLSPSDELKLIHNIAQYTHCLAQGKVGSGFDVSSAVFGSQIYRKFSPDALKGLMTAAEEDPSHPLLPSLLPSNPKWTNTVEPFALPPGTRLMLADVDAGSDTPSLVGKVLAWRESEPERANSLYDELSGCNETLAQIVKNLSINQVANPKAYSKALEIFLSSTLSPPSLSPKDEDAADLFSIVRRQTNITRRVMKRLGDLSGTPIEPDEQTRLLDACLDKGRGVLGVGVPGAGGYDALWVLVVDDPAAIASVEQVWLEWKEMSVCPLASRAEPSGGLRVVEDLKEVDGLEGAIGGRREAMT